MTPDVPKNENGLIQMIRNGKVHLSQVNRLILGFTFADVQLYDKATKVERLLIGSNKVSSDYNNYCLI